MWTRGAVKRVRVIVSDAATGSLAMMGGLSCGWSGEVRYWAA